MEGSANKEEKETEMENKAEAEKEVLDWIGLSKPI